ncbi:MAG: hypothetical protein FWH01_09765 [Oscillospiraceae bacterium]|nr:hypothetical protein [Oscillospiraceae bacterium]
MEIINKLKVLLVVIIVLVFAIAGCNSVVEITPLDGIADSTKSDDSASNMNSGGGRATGGGMPLGGIEAHAAGAQSVALNASSSNTSKLVGMWVEEEISHPGAYKGLVVFFEDGTVAGTSNAPTPMTYTTMDNIVTFGGLLAVYEISGDKLTLTYLSGRGSYSIAYRKVRTVPEEFLRPNPQSAMQAPGVASTTAAAQTTTAAAASAVEPTTAVAQTTTAATATTTAAPRR